MKQVPLFDEARKQKFIAEAMDEINDQYGEFTVTWARLRKETITRESFRRRGGRQETGSIKIMWNAEC